MDIEFLTQGTVLIDRFYRNILLYAILCTLRSPNSLLKKSKIIPLPQGVTFWRVSLNRKHGRATSCTLHTTLLNRRCGIEHEQAKILKQHILILTAVVIFESTLRCLYRVRYSEVSDSQEALKVAGEPI